MAKRRTKESLLESLGPKEPSQAFIYTNTPEGQALAEKNSNLDECRAVSHYRDFSNLAPNVSGRPGFEQGDYDYFRPNERAPTKYKDIIAVCDNIHKRVGLIRNMIDLMGDFTCQGIRVVHPNKKIEKFYENWFIKVKGKERSERIANNLYRLAQVYIRRNTAKLPLKAQEALYKSEASNLENNLSVAMPDRIGFPEGPELSKYEVPWSYSFLYPGCVEPVGESLGAFVGKPLYALNLPQKLRRVIKNPKNAAERSMVAEIPQDIVEAASTNQPYVLDPKKTISLFYKKDDWETFATPILYSILPDISLLLKLKLTDRAALDGATSKVRVWKLGDHKEKIAVTDAAVAKLGEILENNVGGGTIDIIWNSAIDLLESGTDVHEFLKEEKYNQTLNAIYAGMGIPPTLTGTYGSSGTTNNLMSLKTLIERLKYGRDILIKFWEYELVLIQKAMGFRFPAQLEFDYMNLENEASEKNLWIQLADRRLISDELLQLRFNADPNMEKIRLNREEKERENGTRVEQAGPYFDGQIDHTLRKIALQTGVATPSEVGLELEQNKRGEKSALELRQPKTPTQTSSPIKKKKKGQPQQGRPKNSNDKTKRKTKRFTPKMKAMELWAKETQNAIAEVVNPIILQHFEKPNMRSLTDEENSYAENVKFGVLTNIAPFTKISEGLIHEVISECPLNPKYLNYLEITKSKSEEYLGRKLLAEEYRQIQTYCYAVYKSGVENGQD